MANERDDQEKTEEPSQYKLEESRKKGEVAASKEVSSLLILSATFLTLLFSSVFVYETLVEFIDWIITLKPQLAFSPKVLKEITARAVSTGLICAAPVFAVSFCIGIFAQVMQVGFLYAPEVLTLKLDRVNPINGTKKLFSKKAIAEVIKGLFKFTVILGITYMLMKDDILSFIGFLQVDFLQGFMVSKALMLKVSFGILAGLVIVAICDFAWEKYQYKKKLMMSKQEAKEESKEKEGNPEVKQKIRSIQREMATKRMMGEVPKADVIITNPTHLSVALKYDMDTMISPQIIAKGADSVAMRIRELAKENDIPLVENVPLARSLYKTVEIGDPVPRGLYKAVAEVLAFVYKLKKKKKALALG